MHNNAFVFYTISYHFRSLKLQKLLLSVSSPPSLIPEQAQFCSHMYLPENAVDCAMGQHYRKKIESHHKELRNVETVRSYSIFMRMRAGNSGYVEVVQVRKNREKCSATNTAEEISLGTSTCTHSAQFPHYIWT